MAISISPMVIVNRKFYFEPDPDTPSFDPDAAVDSSPARTCSVPTGAWTSVVVSLDEHPTSAGTIRANERAVTATIFISPSRFQLTQRIEDRDQSVNEQRLRRTASCGDPPIFWLPPSWSATCFTPLCIWPMQTSVSSALSSATPDARGITSSLGAVSRHRAERSKLIALWPDRAVSLGAANLLRHRWPCSHQRLLDVKLSGADRTTSLDCGYSRVAGPINAAPSVYLVCDKS